MRARLLRLLLMDRSHNRYQLLFNAQVKLSSLFMQSVPAPMGRSYVPGTGHVVLAHDIVQHITLVVTAVRVLVLRNVIDPTTACTCKV